MSKLNVLMNVEFNDDIESEELHNFNSSIQSFKNSDETKITINHTDLYSWPTGSFIEIIGSISVNKADGTPHAITKDNFYLTNNAFAFLFDEIRYELNDNEICKVRDVGTTTTMKAYPSFDQQGQKLLELAGWLDSPDAKQSNFSYTTKKNKN